MKKAVVEVLSDRCQGHGRCHMEAPDLFSLHDEDGHAAALRPTVEGPALLAALRARDNCPERAIVLSDLSDDCDLMETAAVSITERAPGQARPREDRLGGRDPEGR